MTASSERVTVVVPTYNERENLSDLARAVSDLGYDVLIVDDASPDGTGDIADQLVRDNRRISVLHRTAKEGLGPAYAAAFDHLLETDTEIVVEMDADFSHDPADLSRLVAAIENGADLAIGSRYVPGGSTPDWPVHRRLISQAGNLYARVMLGTPTKDSTAGFRAFGREALGRLPYQDAETSGYGFQVEMAWRAHQLGLAIVEVPISFKDRTRGTSKMSMRIVVEAMWVVTIWGLGRFWRKLPFITTSQ